MEEEELELEDIQRHWSIATEGLAEWRNEARESYDFAAGHQWDSEDEAKLNEEERPAVTFDRVGVFVDAVSGMEINNRQMIKYLPVEPGDIHVNDVLTHAAAYYERECGAQDEDSEAVRDTIICGVGVTETTLSYDRNQDGAPAVTRRDPLSTWFDPRSTRRNLKDGEFVFYGDWLSRSEAESRWPDAEIFSSSEPGKSRVVLHADTSFRYREDNSISQDNHPDQIFVLHYQCWKYQDIWRVRDPQSGKLVELNKQGFEAAKKLLEDATGVAPVENKDWIKGRKKVFYRAFVSGEEILEQKKLPVDQFTFKFVTFKRDRNRKIWYGMVRSAKDPQRWSNKWLSQILHIVNSNAKGGAFVEANAFVDPRDAEQKWAQAAPLMLMKEGAVSGGKIKERAPSPYPSGLDRLMQFAFDALPAVTGINLEILGLADRQQAGVLESQRRQSAYGILAPLFAAIREYRKERGELLLEIIDKLIPEGSLIQVVGEGESKYIPLTKSPGIKYDVQVTQAPDSPDYKKEVWDALSQILPAMMKAGYPIPPELLLSSPLPTEVAEQWVQWIKTQGWMPPEHKQQMEQNQQMLQQVGQENQKLKEEMMQSKLDRTLEVMDLQRKVKDSTDRNQVKTYQTEMESVNRRVEAIIKAQTDAMEARVKSVEISSNARSQALDRHVKVLEAVLKDKQQQAAMAPNIRLEIPERQEMKTQAPGPKKRKKIKAMRMPDGAWMLEEAEQIQ